MFNRKSKIQKIHKTDVNATNSYVMSVLCAALKQELGTDIYLTQTKFTVHPPTAPDGYAKAHRRFSTSELKMDVMANITSLDIPRPRGSEGVLPTLPHVSAIVCLTNEMSGWYSWDILNLSFVVSEYPGYESRNVHLYFTTDPMESKRSLQAPADLIRLAQELQHRGPSRFQPTE
jgi:hypothetical protein